jgi:hypothetical protein
MEASLPPMIGSRVVRWHAVAEHMTGDEAESRVTMGLDFLKPYQRASNRWRMDAKASSSHNALIRSHSRRWRPSLAHTAWNQAPHRGWV